MIRFQNFEKLQNEYLKNVYVPTSQSLSAIDQSESTTNAINDVASMSSAIDNAAINVHTDYPTRMFSPISINTSSDKSVENTSQEKTFHVKGDPLKKFLTSKTSRVQQGNDKIHDPTFNTLNTLNQDLIANSVMEIDVNSLMASGILTYNAWDYVEKGLLELDNYFCDDIAKLSAVDTLSQAKLIFDNVQSDSQSLRYFHRKLNFLYDYGIIPRSTCSDKLEFILRTNLTKLLKLKGYWNGGSRKSGRSQKDMISERLEISKNALKIVNSILYNLQFYALSNFVFLYHDTLVMYHKQGKEQTEERQHIISLIEKGLAVKDDYRLKIHDLRHLIKQIKNYSEKMEHANGFTYRKALNPYMNEWVNYYNEQKMNFVGSDMHNLISEVTQQRKYIQSEVTLLEERKSTLKILQDDINRRKRKIKEYEGETNISDMIMNEHKKIRITEDEIDQMNRNINQPQLKLIHLEVRLLNELAQERKSLLQGLNVPNHNIAKSLMAWLDPQSTQVTRI